MTGRKRETERNREREGGSDRERERVTASLKRWRHMSLAPDGFPAALLLIYCCFTEEMEGVRNQERERARAVSSNLIFVLFLLLLGTRRRAL